MDIFSVITLLGGLTFFLFGMDVMSKNLEKLAGGKLEGILKKMTATPLIGLLLGTVITCVIQSSSATTVMLVGLVNSGLMSFHQAVGPTFGAGIGTTITAWILSLMGIESSNIFVQFLKPAVFSLVLAFIGIIFDMFAKKEKLKTTGHIFIGFAILIFGMELMSGATEPLTQLEGFDVVVAALTNPVLGLVAAAIFTAIIQSSSASIGILQVISLSGKITFGTAIPIIIGQNIGTCITALISALTATPKAKRVAVIHLLIKVLGALIFLPLYLLGNWLFNFAFVDMAIDPVGIAIVHTAFNVINTAALMPFSKWLEKLVCKIVPEKEVAQEDNLLVVDERLFRSPAIAVAECASASLDLAKLSHKAVLKSMSLFDKFDDKGMDELVSLEDDTDRYEDRLGTYLVRVSTLSLTKEESHCVAKMLHAIGDFERLGDHALNLAKAAEEMNDKSLSFSAVAQEEIKVLRDAVEKILENTLIAYENDDLHIASKIEPLEQVIDKIIYKIRTRHIERLQKGECTIELGFILSDILGNYERISDHCSNIAVAVIEAQGDSFDSHKYLHDVKENSEYFGKKYEEYKEMFNL